MTPDAPQDPARPYRKGEARRAEILAKAIDLFAEHGVEASLRAIGEAIGVSHAALRYYFASRDELLVGVYRAHERGSKSGADSGSDSGSGSGSETGLIPASASAVEVMEISARLNRTIPGLIELYATLTTDALQERQHPVTREFIQERFVHVRADLAERIRAGQAAGDIDATIDPDDAAALVAAASDGLQLQWLLHPDAVDIGRSIALLERLLPGSSPTG
jgi:AcrR family transcriptional regulator